MSSHSPQNAPIDTAVSKCKVLILFAHPSLDRSEVNSQMVKAAKGLEGVTLIDLYAEYPSFQINIEREQQRLLDHDVIIFQHPLYWYSTPAILKEWQDLVLEHNFAYGDEGTALRGKTFLCALTAGGREAAYKAEGFNNFTLRELLRPLEQMACLCGMTYLPPFSLFRARTATEDGRVAKHAYDWLRLLLALRDDQCDFSKAFSSENLATDLNLFIKEVK